MLPAVCCTMKGEEVGGADPQAAIMEELGLLPGAGSSEQRFPSSCSPSSVQVSELSSSLLGSGRAITELYVHTRVSWLLRVYDYMSAAALLALMHMHWQVPGAVIPQTGSQWQKMGWASSVSIRSQ